LEGADLMREIGKIVSRFNRFIICKSDRRAKTLLGDNMYSEKGELMGTVIDIFGPVTSPYLKILKKNGENVDTVYMKQ